MTHSTDIGLRIQSNSSPCPFSRGHAKAPSFLTLRFGPSWKPCSLLACSGRQAPGGSTPADLTTLRSPGRPLKENHKFFFSQAGPGTDASRLHRPPARPRDLPAPALPVSGPNPQGCHGGSVSSLPTKARATGASREAGAPPARPPPPRRHQPAVTEAAPAAQSGGGRSDRYPRGAPRAAAQEMPADAEMTCLKVSRGGVHAGALIDRQHSKSSGSAGAGGANGRREGAGREGRLLLEGPGAARWGRWGTGRKELGLGLLGGVCK